MTPEEFEEKIRQDCKACGITLKVSKYRSLRDAEGVSNGWFDGETLAYAKGQPVEKWFPVALHEYNHMCQWSEGDPIWHNAVQEESDEYLWEWLHGNVELPSKKSHLYAMTNLQLELDCERRSIKMIRELALPLDPSYYAQTANAYVLFYHMVSKHRKWYQIGKEPYNIPEIVSQMPIDLYTLNYEELSNEMVTLFETHMPYLISR